MTAKHTPGPWVFCNETLCQGSGRYLHLGRWIEAPGLKGAAEANMRLIEAAPDLLEAVSLLFGVMTRAQDQAQIDAAMGKAFAAISKAKGL